MAASSRDRSGAALPDPQFTFQADVADTLMSFMPG